MFLEIHPQAAKQESTRLPIPEAQIATLREAYERYASACPFKPGDLVTPRNGFGYADAGRPHIVLEVAEAPQTNFSQTERVTVYSAAYGMRLDIRVANFTKDGDVLAYWQESWRLEPYTGEGA